MTGSPIESGATPISPALEGGVLAWDDFSALHFPGRRRHDLDAVAAYGAYRQGRDWRKSGSRSWRPRLTLVPTEPVGDEVEAGAKVTAAEPLLVAVAAVHVADAAGGADRS
jgi:hypothetical protein